MDSVDPTTRNKPSEQQSHGFQPRKLIPPTIAGNVTIGEYCVLGTRAEARIGTEIESTGYIGDGTLLGNFVTLYEGVVLGQNVVVEDYVRMGYDSGVDHGARIMYGAYICDRVNIGVNARVAGFVCDTAIIGDRCTSMGKLVHAYSDPSADWWGPDEASPALLDESSVGMGAIVVGGVTIGPGSYVAAGAVVTRSVPPNTMVTGINQHRVWK